MRHAGSERFEACVESRKTCSNGSVKVFSSKRRIAAAAALVLLALFVLRPGASRLKSRIISALSAGMGRPVDLGSAHIRLLPRPGFDLDNLVVYDDPAFGAEPMLRASEVTADLRLISLLRGRLEIARLDLTEPSLNLVRNESGRWNLEALLERTAHTSTAPTAKAKSEPRPGFPYIEGSSARINFKNGEEKKPYALTNADFSLWQESENSWGVRLKAQPVRTDLNLNDTGLLQVTGTWQRAATLHETPLQFSIEWSRAQLGQVSKLFTGNDKGWRGGILLDATLTGSPEKLQITSTASVDDFRRYDITAGRALRLAANCDGEYSSLTHEFHEVECSAPIGKGFVRLAGDIGLPGSHRLAVDVTAERVPAVAVVALAQRAKKNLPDDLAAEGALSGKFFLRQDTSANVKSRLEGRGEMAGFRLSSAVNNAEIGPETIPFVLTSGGRKSPPFGKLRAGFLAKEARNGAPIGHSPVRQVPVGPHIELGPIPVEVARTGAPTLRGWVNREGYEFALVGEIDAARALRLARMVGLPASGANPEGSAQVDLQIAGTWMGHGNQAGSGFAGPQITGTAKLRNVKVAVHGAGGPVDIVSAEMQLLPGQVRVGKLIAKAAGTEWNGSLMMPRGCGHPEGCPVYFVLDTAEVSFAQLSQWAHPGPKKRAWYQVLEGNTQAGPSVLARLQGEGSIKANRLQIGSVDAAHVSVQVILDRGTLNVRELNADFLGGVHRGMWHTDFTSTPTLCEGSGQVAGASLARLANAMKDAWIAGTATANYHVKGPCNADFWRAAEGTMRIEMRDGILRHISLGATQEPFQFTRLSGQADLRDGKLELSHTNAESPEGKFEISGTATLQREMSLKMTRLPSGTGSGYEISGTLAEPRVAPLARTEQAKLKPIGSK